MSESDRIETRHHEAHKVLRQRVPVFRNRGQKFRLYPLWRDHHGNAGQHSKPQSPLSHRGSRVQFQHLGDYFQQKLSFFRPAPPVTSPPSPPDCCKTLRQIQLPGHSESIADPSESTTETIFPKRHQ
jgi:hypothetical protein